MIDFDESEELSFLKNRKNAPSDEEWESLDNAFNNLFIGEDAKTKLYGIEEKPVVQRIKGDKKEKVNSLEKEVVSLEDEYSGLDKSVLEIFLEEAEDQVKILDKEWSLISEKEIFNSSDFSSFKRVIHTFKGNAGMVGANQLHALAHDIETEITDLEEGRIDWLEIKQNFGLGIKDMMEWVIWVQTPEHIPSLKRKTGTHDFEITELVKPARKVEEKTTKQDIVPQTVEAMVRLKAKSLDNLLQDIGIWGSGQTALKSQNSKFKNTIKDFETNVERMQKLLKEVEIAAEAQISARKTEMGEIGGMFDPLEMDRFTRLQEATRIMAESIADLSGIQSDFNLVAKTNDELTQQQLRGVKSAQDILTEARMTPLDAIGGKLRKVVALAAKESHKEARLDFIGDEVRLDRSVLERLVAPLEHLLRNAVSHGIEMPDDRVIAGKNRSGNIMIEAIHSNTNVVIVCKDDGSGINYDKVLNKAKQKGWVSESDMPSKDEVFEFIFRPGFSTAESITGLSGRGVGMDVVKTEVEALGGKLSISSENGVGTVFKLEVPLTVATTQALVVKAGYGEWALPAQSVKQVHTIKKDQLEAAYKQNKLMGEKVAYLLDLLSPDKIEPKVDAYNTVIEFEIGNSKLYVHVDSLISTDDVVIRPLAKPLSLVVGFAGTAYLGEGRMGLLIQPFALFDKKSKIDYSKTTSKNKVEKQKTVKQITAMVVDDSLTVRKVTGDLLRSKGLSVILAKDGVDALEKLQDEMPDIMLVDLEMPRMNGFELVGHLRNTIKFANIPIVMITSRTAEKHQEEARKLGVNAYLGKPYQETELLDQISKWTSDK